MFIFEDKFIFIYCLLMAFAIGTVFGSFLNCAAWRIAHGESVFYGRSHCTTCGHTLGALDLIPVFSWALSGGKCRYCKDPVSARYPLTELFLGIMFVLGILRFGITILFFRNVIFLCLLFTLSLVDLEIYIIPDVCILASFILWIVTLPFMGYGVREIITHILAMILYGGLILLLSLTMDKILGKESMGGGDIKLFGIMGLYLGMLSSLFAVFISCILGILFFTLKNKDSLRDGAIPFGPSIAAATWFMLLYGESITNWYLSLL